MELKPLEITHRDLVNEYFKKYPPQISEFTFTNLFLWRHSRPLYFTEIEETLVFFIYEKGNESLKKVIFGPPVGNVQVEKLINLLKNDIAGAVRIDENIAMVLKNYGMTVEEDRDNDDYLYLVSNLSMLEGRKYSKKRNHIKNCLNAYSCQYEKITQSIIDECLDLQDKWCNIKSCDATPGLYHENMAIQEAFKKFGEFDIFGGVIRIDGVIKAYAIGERLNNDTAVCHFEKADTDYIGLNQLITHWFTKYSLSGYKYVNREQDLGSPGLRQAKLSYYPEKMIKKYIVRF